MYTNTRKHETEVVFHTDAGISVESITTTDRGENDLWNEQSSAPLSTAAVLVENPAEVLAFFNELRCLVADAAPNDAHKAIVHSRGGRDVLVVSSVKMDDAAASRSLVQNIDNLGDHDSAGKIFRGKSGGMAACSSRKASRRKRSSTRPGTRSRSMSCANF